MSNWFGFFTKRVLHFSSLFNVDGEETAGINCLLCMHVVVVVVVGRVNNSISV
jgi:hypothetical protein